MNGAQHGGISKLIILQMEELVRGILSVVIGVGKVVVAFYLAIWLLLIDGPLPNLIGAALLVTTFAYSIQSLFSLLYNKIKNI